MINTEKSFDDYLRYAGIDNLPAGIEDDWAAYEDDGKSVLIERDFLETVFDRFNVASAAQDQLLAALTEIESDATLLALSKFIVHDICSAYNRLDYNEYDAMRPTKMEKYGEYYSFLILLACVEPSRKMLAARGVPSRHYEELSDQAMERQFLKLSQDQNPAVSDFSWEMKLYTSSIFRFGRFDFIPLQFLENFAMYRDVDNGQVVALRLAGETFRSDGQYDGINGVFDEEGGFETIWEEDHHIIRANVSSPMGFVRKEVEEFHKHDLKLELEPGHLLLSIHIPSGPDYTPERLKASMIDALQFFDRYFPELDIRGFWSESWFFDARLSLILDEEQSRIVRMQRQLYLHPLELGDEMLRYEVFGGWDVDPETVNAASSLQRGAQAYMKDGGRFTTTGMTVLRDDVEKIPNRPYITEQDITEYGSVVDKHLKK